MSDIALTIGGGNTGNGTPVPTFSVSFPSQAPIVGLQSIVTFVVQFALFGAILLAFFFLLYGGIKWIMSGGDKKQVEGAQKTIQYALIGLVVVFLSFFIINLIGFAFGVSLLSVTGK